MVIVKLARMVSNRMTLKENVLLSSQKLNLAMGKEKS